MTTVVYRNGEMVADSAATCGDRIEGSMSKIFLTRHGVIGVAGSIPVWKDNCDYWSPGYDL